LSARYWDVRRHLHRLRSLLPLSLRLALQEHSPGRARRWRENPGVERVAPGGIAVLTFDDGPDAAPDATAAVLDQLDAIDAKATFFVLGEQIEAAPGLVAEIVARGHEVGLHGQRHFRHDRVSVEESAADVEAGYQVLSECLGEAPRLYRPPYGKLSQGAAEVCRKHGLEVVYWSTWGLDWEPLSAERVATRATRDLDDGSIVLLHDSARYAVRPNAAPTASALASIGAAATARGLRLVTLAEARQASAPPTDVRR
jgi:peptidoglycan/xylan/chitin deacetylase (PgdA/CDA1 family)